MLKALNDVKLMTVMVVFAVIAIHSALVLFPPINLEFAFVDAARFFNSSDKQILLDQYFSYQANTLGLPYFSSVIARIFPGIDLLSLIRLINLGGLVLLSVGIYRICNFLGQKNHLAIIVLILLNPIVWTFSGRATADFLPMAVGIFALSLALGEGYFIWRALIAGIFLGLATILKYHTLCLLLFLVALLWEHKFRLENVMKVTIIATVSILMAGAYLIKVHSLFGFWVIPAHFQSTLQLNIYKCIDNFILYAGFLAMVGMPTALLSSEFRAYISKHWKFLIPCFGILLLYGFNGLQDIGELNFGPLDAWMGGTLRVVLLSSISLTAMVLIFISSTRISRADKLRIPLGLALVGVLLVFSLSRPAQRYLLPMLPFFLLALPSGVIRSRAIFLSTVGIFICANIFIEYSRWCTGTAAKIMADKIEVAGLLKVTNAGAIDGHVGNRFYQETRSNKVYSVVSGKSSQSVLTSQAGFSFLEKSFSLIPAGIAKNNKLIVDEK